MVPDSFRSERLLLRRWAPADAPALGPVLEANHDYLAPWIPARIATPAPLPELEARLAGFAAEFAAGREWRYGMFGVDDGEVYGEVGLFPRNHVKRTPITDADRIEVGYWLRADRTGRGLATEAARAALALAVTLPGLRLAEIRCDARNLPSAAIPQRLGFTLTTTELEQPAAPDEPPVELQVWVLELPG